MRLPRIKKMRKKYCLKKKEVARYLGCKKSKYKKYEAGKEEMPMNYIAMLAQLYNTSMDYLYELSNDKRPYV